MHLFRSDIKPSSLYFQLQCFLLSFIFSVCSHSLSDLYYRASRPAAVPIFDVSSIHHFNFIAFITLLCLKPFLMQHTFKILKTCRSIHLAVLLRLHDEWFELKATDRFSSWQNFWSYPSTVITKAMKVTNVKRTATRKTRICVAEELVFSWIWRDVTAFLFSPKNRQ